MKINVKHESDPNPDNKGYEVKVSSDLPKLALLQAANAEVTMQNMAGTEQELIKQLVDRGCELTWTDDEDELDVYAENENTNLTVVYEEVDEEYNLDDKAILEMLPDSIKTAVCNAIEELSERYKIIAADKAPMKDFHADMPAHIILKHITTPVLVAMEELELEDEDDDVLAEGDLSPDWWTDLSEFQWEEE